MLFLPGELLLRSGLGGKLRGGFGGVLMADGHALLIEKGGFLLCVLWRDSVPIVHDTLIVHPFVRGARLAVVGPTGCSPGAGAQQGETELCGSNGSWHGWCLGHRLCAHH